MKKKYQFLDLRKLVVSVFYLSMFFVNPIPSNVFYGPMACINPYQNRYQINLIYLHSLPLVKKKSVLICLKRASKFNHFKTKYHILNIFQTFFRNELPTTFYRNYIIPNTVCHTIKIYINSCVF